MTNDCMKVNKTGWTRCILASDFNWSSCSLSVSQAPICPMFIIFAEARAVTYGTMKIPPQNKTEFTQQTYQGRQYPGLILWRTSGLEAAVGKFLSNFQTRKVNCSTLTARNVFGGNFIKIMKTCVNGNTLMLSLLQKWRPDVLVQ